MATLRIWQKRLLLVLMGITIGLVGVEVGLRVAGSCVFARQSQRQRSTGDGQEVVVLCLGESTTAETVRGDSYPRQLQEILTERRAGIAFKVVNLGVPGTTTGSIVSQLDSALAEHHPDIVITMMGINDVLDRETHDKPARGTWFRSLRIIKLLRFAFTKASRFCMLPEVSTAVVREEFEVPDPTCFLSPDELGRARVKGASAVRLASYELAKTTLSEGRTDAAIESFKTAIRNHPQHVKSYVRLGSLYCKLGQPTNAVALLERALEVLPEEPTLLHSLAAFREIATTSRSAEYGGSVEFPSDDLAYARAARMARMSTIDEVISRAIEELEGYVRGDTAPIVALLTSASVATGSGVSEATVHRIVQLAQDRLGREGCERVVGGLAAACCSLGNPRLADYCWNVCRTIQRDYCDPVTLQNYRELQQIVLDSGATLIAMQYPMLDLVRLERIVPSSDRTVLVDNSTVFRSAVAADSLATYFTDMFGGAFGHCTRKGNHLLALNVAETVLRIASYE